MKRAITLALCLAAVTAQEVANDATNVDVDAQEIEERDAKKHISYGYGEGYGYGYGKSPRSHGYGYGGYGYGKKGRWLQSDDEVTNDATNVDLDAQEIDERDTQKHGGYGYGKKEAPTAPPSKKESPLRPAVFVHHGKKEAPRPTPVKKETPIIIKKEAPTPKKEPAPTPKKEMPTPPSSMKKEMPTPEPIKKWTNLRPSSKGTESDN